MKSIAYKDHQILHIPEQDEIVILGGKEELKQEEIKDLASIFFETHKEFNLFKSKVYDATEDGGWDFKYYHFTLSYGSNSLYDPRNPNFNEGRNNRNKL
jgi:hypothetical protein